METGNKIKESAIMNLIKICYFFADVSLESFKFRKEICLICLIYWFAFSFAIDFFTKSRDLEIICLDKRRIYLETTTKQKLQKY